MRHKEVMLFIEKNNEKKKSSAYVVAQTYLHQRKLWLCKLFNLAEKGKTNTTSRKPKSEKSKLEERHTLLTVINH